MSQLVRVVRLGVVLSVLSLAGCPAPYSLNIHEINEGRFYGGRDEPAAIELSTPQIYAREALINDRRDEQKYLNDLLTESTKIAFEPQLVRETELIRSLAADLKLAYDPSAGAAIQRSDRVAELQAERDLAQLRNETRTASLQAQLDQERLRQQLGALRAGTTATAPAGDMTAAAPAAGTAPAAPAAQGQAAPAAQPSAGGAVPATPAGSAAPGSALPENQAAQKLSEVVEKLDQMLDELPKEARPTTVKPDPREQFRDRQAYRSDLRSALAEAVLDDAHDDVGNALFRLQFRATVMPGRIKDKYGMARLTVEPPAVTLQDLTELYYGWLAHATYRLNVAQSSREEEGRNNLPRRDYEALAAASGLFDVAHIYLHEGKAGAEIGDLGDYCQGISLGYEKRIYGCEELLLAVPPGEVRFVQQAFAGAPQLLLPLTAELLRVPEQLSTGVLKETPIEPLGVV